MADVKMTVIGYHIQYGTGRDATVTILLPLTGGIAVTLESGPEIETETEHGARLMKTADHMNGIEENEAL
ncbi:hypothetical protein PHLCEN_2v4552 [Hermanssonia centrifuga]|uniref:Uncharacterized protein n=1 Tax=Hermanssonia centrifuga TaxID=98765 RepID=A0A2R6PNM9_9APHY|nr:hypothetical protein PHLCEN_2v4552 [Hermanssonia centrifuga]